MKKKILITLLITTSIFAQDNLIMKVNDQTINLEKDNSSDSITFYNIEPKEVFEKNKFKSCLLEENRETQKLNIFCTHKNLKTYFTEVNGFITPDEKLMSYTPFYSFKNLELEIKRLRGK